MGVVDFRTPPHGIELGTFFGKQGQIGQPLSEEISLLKCSSRSKQKILGLYPFVELTIQFRKLIRKFD